MSRFLLNSLASLALLSLVAMEAAAQPNYGSPSAASLTGAWQREQIDADGDEFLYYFMTNKRFLLFIHQDRVIRGERGGSYRVEGGNLVLSFDDGRTSVIPIRFSSVGTMHWGPADQPEKQTTWNHLVGDVRLREKNGDDVILKSSPKH
jgi:hypothetical protein